MAEDGKKHLAYPQKYYAVDTHGFKSLSRIGLIVLKAHAAINHLRDSRTLEDPHKRGIAHENYKKHRRDVFLLLAGLPGQIDPVSVLGKIRSDLTQVADEHASGTSALDAVAQSVDTPFNLVETYAEAFRLLFRL